MRKLKLGAILRAMIRLVTDSRFMLGPASAFFVAIAAAQLLQKQFAVADHRAIGAVIGLLSIPLLLALIVKTHRYILLGEEPALNISGLIWPYVGRAILINLPIAIVVIAGTIMLGPSVALGRAAFTPTDYAFAAAFLVIFIALYVGLVMPMSLGLPATAKGRTDFTLQNARDAARANFGPLFLLALVLTLVTLAWSLPIRLTALNAYMTMQPNADVMTQTLEMAVSAWTSIGAILGGILWAAMLSFAYAGLVEYDERYAA